MRRRILFVDDEALVLEGLQRMLRPMRGEWDMQFVDTGRKALEMMEEVPFDVVVSDMHMPGMNGAELLAEVMKRSPKTVRLVLSGHTDPDLVLKCVACTHQYLSKPCGADDLKAAIARAAKLQRSLKDQNLRQLVSRMDRLPSMPSLYLKVVDKLQDPRIALDDIGELVAQDLAMTAKILKLVNSAFFGLGRRISNPAEAVSYLGLDTLKALVLSLHAFSQFADARLGPFSIDQLWAHSQSTAGLAKQIARMEQAEQRVLNEAFVAGLLHDTGKLVLASNFDSQYDHLLKAGPSDGPALLAAEEAVFGANHAEVGAYLLGLWGLPVPVVEAIALHHQPRSSEDLIFSPLTAVHVADALLHAQETGHPAVEQFDLEYLSRLGLSDRLEDWCRTADAKSGPTEKDHVG